jgi:preprotein translocase subunit SecF
MSFLRRLYRGETNLDFVGYRKRWYIASGAIILVCILAMIFLRFNFGVEFDGGNQFTLPVKAGTSESQIRSAASAGGVEVSSVFTRGKPDARYVVRTPVLSESQRAAVVESLSKAGKVAQTDVARTEVSSSWGKAVSQKALIGLVIFLIAVGVYIWIRFEQRMAIAALAALAHDLILTAGVYSLVGFEVTPGTIIGLLTILGFSLYDTVVVFDKVDENARGLLGSSRYTYAEAANLAVNQTLMRSINTSLIALLPVAGLLFVGAGLLGVGTLKDLALVLFVGMLTGAYSSLFLATPWLVDLKMTDQRYKLHAQRVLARRSAAEKGEEPARPAARAKAGAAKAGAAKAAPGKGAARPGPAKAAGTKAARPKPGNAAPPVEPDDVDEIPAEEVDADDVQARIDALASSSAPRVGAKPPQRKRPSSGGRPGGKRR